MSKFDFSGESFGMDSERRSRTRKTDHTEMPSEARKGGSEPGAIKAEELVASGDNRAQTAAQAPKEVPTGKRADKAVKTMEKMQITSIRFTPENHRYVRKEAAMRGMTVIEFVNYIVDLYKSDPGNVHTSGVYMDEDA